MTEQQGNIIIMLLATSTGIQWLKIVVPAIKYWWNKED